MEEFAGERVAELQHGGMQRLASEPEQRAVGIGQGLRFDLQEQAFVGAVKLVSDEREPERMQRGADLMLSAGPENGADERHIRRHMRFFEQFGHGGFGGGVEADCGGLRTVRKDEPFLFPHRA